MAITAIRRDFTPASIESINEMLWNAHDIDPAFHPVVLPDVFAISIVSRKATEFLLTHIDGDTPLLGALDAAGNDSISDLVPVVWDFKPRTNLAFASDRAIFGQSADRHIMYKDTKKLAAFLCRDQGMMPVAIQRMLEESGCAPEKSRRPSEVSIDIGWMRDLGEDRINAVKEMVQRQLGGASITLGAARPDYI